MPPISSISDLVRQYFRAYEAKDRAALEKLVTDDFTFSSPLDKHLSRKQYFKRCWPNSRHHRTFHLENLFAQQEDAFVTYECERMDGVHFRNTEYFQAENGRIKSVEVFFGSETGATVSEQQIRGIMDQITLACRAKDVDALLAHYAPDVTAFDLVEPLRYAGTGTVKARAVQWFSSFLGPIHYELRNLKISAGDESAFCHSLNHVSGITTEGRSIDMWWRATVCFSKQDGWWHIAHAHSSVPFDMETGLASVDLIP
jgi:ketosteroid isomerase-like protein